jgi:hypothetical protein
MKKIKTYIPLILCLLTVFLLVRCTEKVDITLANNQPRLVVEGMVTNESQVQTVRLTTTTDYFYTQVAPAVTQAKVSLYNGTSTVTLIENPANSGIYVTPTYYIGIPGTQYTLNIELNQAINGQTVYSASEIMPQVYSPDSIKLLYHSDWGKKGYWETQLFVQDPPETNYYSFRGYRNDTLVTDTLSKVGISDDKFYNGRYVNGMTTILWNQEYKSQLVNVGDRIKLQVGAITNGYYNFLDQVKMEVEPKNPLFSGPSANVTTNISNGGFGYFAVCAMSYVSTTAKK